MNTLIGYDLVPEPKILEAALRACRRLNDLASAIRILEAVKVTNTPWLSYVTIQGVMPTPTLVVSSHKSVINLDFAICHFCRTKQALIKTSIRM